MYTENIIVYFRDDFFTKIYTIYHLTENGLFDVQYKRYNFVLPAKIIYGSVRKQIVLNQNKTTQVFVLMIFVVCFNFIVKYQISTR